VGFSCSFVELEAKFNAKSFAPKRAPFRYQQTYMKMM